MSDTVLDRIVACLRAPLMYDQNVRVAPVALLWPDESEQWLQIIERIGEQMPVVSLGDYDPAARRGPAYWIRCVIAGSVDIALPKGTPIVYLPGVSRSTLRAADGCPKALAPIAELQYRSEWFSHPNSRDWTVRALLSHIDRGVGLNIAEDAGTSAALQLALRPLLDERVDHLAKQVLDADYLLELVNEDPVRSLLRWLDDPAEFRAHTDAGRWLAFVQQCKADYGLDPDLEGEITAAGRLGARRGAWAIAWKRFADTPERYPGIPRQLRKARPNELIVENIDAWPQDNERAEDQLRNQLRGFEALTPDGARKYVAKLSAEHDWRRSTVWAELDQAPLAFALEQLVTLAQVTMHPLVAADLESMVADYADRGWRADDAVLRGLAAVTSIPDRDAISAATAAMYRQWVDASATGLQSAIGPLANAHTYETGPQASTTTGTVTVFVDGLRLDIAHRLDERLAASGLGVTMTTTLAALPTVTTTSKPALTPTGPGALRAGPGLEAANATTGTSASIQVLRTLMALHGVQPLLHTETGDVSGAAWTEAGDIDHIGHDVGLRLVDHLDEEIARIAGRIRELLDAGWQKVDVVTDHGWVLLPGGMEKVELPPATTEIKKGRCARLKDGAVVDVPTVPWFWDPDVRIAIAPGLTCFEANKEYEHGGVSLQECIVPRLSVTAGAETESHPEFASVSWLGLQCRVELSGVTGRVFVDVRSLPAEPNSSVVVRAKETSHSGRVSLVVVDEEYEGKPVYLVLVTPGGQILAQREAEVGRNA